jgi:hypothetical protein
MRRGAVISLSDYSRILFFYLNKEQNEVNSRFNFIIFKHPFYERSLQIIRL